MKFLFLFLAILLATEVPVISECWMDGHCRLLCKDGEDSIIRCRNRKRCCVPSRYLTIQPVTIHGILGWTTPQMSTTAPKTKRNIHNG
ncbi:PREDICTED: beta-defensin 119 isoform X2 [Cercocebus atys]|uniref:beta-defensin 119 isoform X2 n=1 Tax=Mandrillus leucophaeus TaxID=9568 RepID=UPI0005F51D60|nr:PREDICTED: beta-defensin 119 isoform X2 [Mandrillus leucophaeus]XP_011907808.1 PREDICTED: beta-defensin 119 isoform X2 [Cercocebus atys]XP_025255583.1 beta-defensin 119 isoform X2 [Theropithecus gelada]